MPSLDPFDYARTAALVTGASRGIGACLAQELAARGCPDIVLTARSADNLRDLAEEMAARHGIRTHVVSADLADPNAPAAIKMETDRLGLTIGLLVNNAGFGDWGPFPSRPLERQERMIAVNCTSLVALTRLYLPGMLVLGRGGILNVASTAAFQPVPYMGVYGATKAFVLSFSEALWSEMQDQRESDIRVVCLCPGSTETAFDFGDAAGRGNYEGVPRASPVDVAKDGIRALDRDASYTVSGTANYIGAMSTRFAPRSIVARVGAAIFRPNKEGEKGASDALVRRGIITTVAVAAGAVTLGWALAARKRREG